MLVDGITYIHEHITIDLSEVKENEDCLLDSYSDTVNEFRELYKKGVRNIIDMTNSGMGRNVDYVRRVSEATGLNILLPTGYYQEAFLPNYVYKRTVKELAERMIKEITVGIKGSPYKASVIGEIATSEGVWTDCERKVFDAAVIAHKETNCPISTHTSIGTLGHEQVSYFLEKGVNLERVIIGHVDLAKNLEYILEMLYKGVFVEFDTIGKNSYKPDEVRVEWLMEIEKRGLIDQVCLAMDITRKSHLVVNGGLGYSYLLDTFIPMCEEAGMSELSINKMLKENPKKIYREFR